MDQNIKTRNLLLYSFLGVYLLTSLGTLAMLFLGVGAVRDGERSLLIGTFLVESALAVAALYYSLWNIKKDENIAIEHTKELIVNPLAESFKDLVIPVESLRLPGAQLHENKHFKRCKFIGPAALVFIGSTIKNAKFINCGDVIPIPEGTFLTGIVCLKDCTVEECEFIQTTLLLTEVDARRIADEIPRMNVAGSVKVTAKNSV